MRRFRYIAILLVCVLRLQLLSAVETILVGDVISRTTGEPIPNASVYFRGSKVGTSTDENGNFVLRVDLNATLKLKVSAVGFRSQLFTIEPGQSLGMQVALEERTESLDELFVLPGVNPALALMDSVRAHRPSWQDVPPTETTLQRNCYISHIPARKLQRRFWQSMRDYMVMAEDSTYMLPVPANLVAELGLSVPEHMDMYESVMPFASTSFLSPIAGSGSTYYRYFLRDSVATDSSKVYLVDFLPKNSFDPLLSGTLSVDSASYAVTHVSARLPYRANIAYLTQLDYEADYTNRRIAGDSMRVLMDINAFRRDTVNHPFPSLMLTQHSRIVSLPGSLAIPLPMDTLAVTSHPSLRTEDVPLPPLFRFAYWLSYLVHTGYISTGTWLDLGSVSEIIRYSDYEGLHLGLPFRTNERLMPHVSLEGYVAYGFRDRGVKGKAQLSALLPTTRRNLLGAYVWDHYVYDEVGEFSSLARENTFSYNNLSFTSYLTAELFNWRRTTAPDISRRQEARVWWESDWCSSHGSLPGVESRLALSLAQQDTLHAARGRFYRDQTAWLRYAQLSAVVRLSWGEKTVDAFTVRRHIYSKYPTLFLGASIGSYQSSIFNPQSSILNQPSLFGRLHLTLRHDVPLGVGGKLLYIAEAGCTLGAVPSPLLDMVNGNDSYVFDPYRFTLMGGNQFPTSRHMSAQVYWNGGGIVFNRIPGIRYLRLRELAEAKFAWGDGALKVPYTELGLGIGNILGCGEIWCIGRITSTPQVACRFRLHIGM